MLSESQINLFSHTCSREIVLAHVWKLCEKTHSYAWQQMGDNSIIFSYCLNCCNDKLLFFISRCFYDCKGHALIQFSILHINEVDDMLFIVWRKKT